MAPTAKRQDDGNWRDLLLKSSEQQSSVNSSWSGTKGIKVGLKCGYLHWIKTVWSKCSVKL